MSEAITHYNLFIFDLDGTIVDLSINWKTAKSELKQTFQLPFQPLFPSFERLRDPSKQEAIQILRKHELKEISNMKTNEKIIPFIRYLVNNNKKLAVFSSNSRVTIKRALHKIGLLTHFVILIGLEDVEKHKPHPEGLLMILKHFGEQASNAVYIGNESKDLEAAERSRIRFFFVNKVDTDVGVYTNNNCT